MKIITLQKSKQICPICANHVLIRNSIGDYICKQDDHIWVVRGRFDQVETMFLHFPNDRNVYISYLFDTMDGNCIAHFQSTNDNKTIVQFDIHNIFVPQSIDELENYMVVI